MLILKYFSNPIKNFSTLTKKIITFLSAQNTHKLIMDQMACLGYKARTDGVGKGLAMMFIQAELVGEKTKYDECIEFLSQYSPKQLKVLIKAAKEARKAKEKLRRPQKKPLLC